MFPPTLIVRAAHGILVIFLRGLSGSTVSGSLVLYVEKQQIPFERWEYNHLSGLCVCISFNQYQGITHRDPGWQGITYRDPGRQDFGGPFDNCLSEVFCQKAPMWPKKELYPECCFENLPCSGTVCFQTVISAHWKSHLVGYHDFRVFGMHNLSGWLPQLLWECACLFFSIPLISSFRYK